jgi:hypothetical protein
VNKLVKFEEPKVVDGFTFHEGWWGEFSPTGELVMVYAYPRVEVNNYDWSYSWKFAKIFYPMDGGFVGDLELGYKLPAEVMGDFDVVAEQEMLDQKETFLEYYGE